ncbi:MAG: hypothetical protein GC165_06210 [Armatimonadetes bacterium]|nr:hypothetical protein [Armatimonadota bacterium]
MIHFLLPAMSYVWVHLPTYNLQHRQVFGWEATPYNQAVLAAVDEMQATAPEGGGYFIGVKADPPESPIGVPIALFGKPLLAPPRTSSYCSGASYSAFIGGLNTLLRSRSSELSADRFEAVRMQEPDGGRREDMVKLWGWWNADGPGSLYALALFSGMGERVSPFLAEPGDFCNINWLHGPGHSVVFLGWDTTPEGEIAMRFWSSQKGSNGMGDQTRPLSSMAGIVFTRLTRPEALFTFNPAKKMDRMPIDYDSAKIVAERLQSGIDL